MEMYLEPAICSRGYSFHTISLNHKYQDVTIIFILWKLLIHGGPYCIARWFFRDRPQSCLKSSADPDLFLIYFFIVNFYSSRPFLSYFKGFKMYRKTKKEGKFNISNSWFSLYWKAKSSSIPHGTFSEHPTHTVNPATLTSITLASKKLDFLSESVPLTISLAASLWSVLTTSGIIHIPEGLDTICNSDFGL